MFGLGVWEIAILVLVFVVLFGPKRLPELGTSLGESIKNFKKSYRESKTIDVTPDQSDPNRGGPDRN